MGKLKVALVGYGMAGRTFHAPLIRATSGLELAVVVSSRPEAVLADLPDMKVVADLATALNDPDISLVVIATPNSLHAEQAHAALDTGKHVVIDKPFTTTYAEAQGLADHAKQSGLTLCAFQNRRWDGHILTAKAMIEAGQFGEISHVALRYDRMRKLVTDRWGDLDLPGSGTWFNLGSHLVDQAVHLFGRPQTLWADFSKQREGAINDDYFHVVLGYGTLRVSLHASMITPAPGSVIEIQGTKGALVKYGQDTQEEMLKNRRTPNDKGWGEDSVRASFTGVEGDTALPSQGITCGPGNYPAFYAGMAAVINGTGPSPVSIHDTVLDMYLLELALQSAHEGRRLPVAV